MIPEQYMTFFLKKDLTWQFYYEIPYIGTKSKLKQMI